jgi:hypothetical protein
VGLGASPPAVRERSQALGDVDAGRFALHRATHLDERQIGQRFERPASARVAGFGRVTDGFDTTSVAIDDALFGALP